jgi:penicillin amidase
VLVPFLARVDVPAEVAEVRALLTGWTFEQDAASAPAAYFNAVWRHLLVLTFNDELKEELARPIRREAAHTLTLVP